MARSVCINCGLLKRGTFQICPRCGFDPRANDDVQAKSIRLSTRYWIESEERPPSEQELRTAAIQIESGLGYQFDDDEIAALLAEKRLLDQGLATKDILKIVAFVIALLTPAVIGIMLLIG